MEEWGSKEDHTSGAAPGIVYDLADLKEVKYRGVGKFEFTTESKTELQVRPVGTHSHTHPPPRSPRGWLWPEG